MSIEDSHMLNLSSLLQENETMPSLFGLDFDENFFSFLDSVSPTSIFRQTFAIESSDLDRAFESSPVEREISAYAVLGPDIESVLVMQYFDHMFYQIFDTYCRAVQDPVRGLLSLMAGRSPSLRQTLMSVACARRNVRTPQPDVFFQEPSFKDVFTGSENTSQAYYQRAVNLHNDFVQEIGSGNRWLDTRNLNSYLDALACLIHFIFLEVSLP